MNPFYFLLTCAAAFLLGSCCCGQCLGTGETSKGACPYCGGSGGWNVSPTPFSDQEW